ncbi:MAG: hypothetical protein ACXWH1_05220 [Thermoanaerobaculia bacterium]
MRPPMGRTGLPDASGLSERAALRYSHADGAARVGRAAGARDEARMQIEPGDARA